MAGVLLASGVAAAAPARSVADAPSVANTTQTLLLHATKSGGYKYSAPIVFSTKTFAIPVFTDKGKFTDTGTSLTFKVTKSHQGDKGCSYVGTYDAASTNYAGTYTCPGGFSDTFAVTTSGS